MPDPTPKRSRSGPIIVAAMALAGIAAAIGTCSRFASDNPYSLSVQPVDDRIVLSEFDPKAAAKIQPRMMAVLSFEASDLRREGRVRDVQTNEKSTAVLIEFSEDLPSLRPARVSVDTSFPPEVLK